MFVKRTHDGNDASAAGEDGHRADILLLKSVGDGGQEETGTAKSDAGLDGGLDGILGMVRVVVVAGHGGFGGTPRARGSIGRNEGLVRDVAEV